MGWSQPQSPGERGRKGSQEEITGSKGEVPGKALLSSQPGMEEGLWEKAWVQDYKVKSQRETFPIKDNSEEIVMFPQRIIWLVRNIYLTTISVADKHTVSQYQYQPLRVVTESTTAENEGLLGDGWGFPVLLLKRERLEFPLTVKRSLWATCLMLRKEMTILVL